MKTMDKGLMTSDKNPILTTAELGKKRSITPEGYLLCEDVPIARTGTQTYSVSEIMSGTDDKPLDGDADGRLIVDRPDDQVFNPATIASFEGKSVTVEHPNDFVTPTNYKQFEVGHVQNVHRGDGIENDLLLADLLIKDPGAIAYVNKSLPEVSCGYNADYDQTEKGKATQVNIIGNHVALVDQGRAGPRCAIKDSISLTSEYSFMKKKGKFLDTLGRMFVAVQSKDEKELEKIAKEVADDDGDDDMDMTMDARLKDAEKWIADRKAKDAEMEAKGKAIKEAEEKKTADALLAAEAASARIKEGKEWTGDSLSNVFSRAEILAPGIALPTQDSAKNVDAVEAFMRKALLTADAADKGKESIAPFLLGRELKSLTGDALTGVFVGAAELMKHRNNNVSRLGVTVKDFGAQPPTNAQLNAEARKRWNRA